MNVRIKSSLLVIYQSIDEIFIFLGARRNFSEYHSDIKTNKAVERNLEITGEAVYRILKEAPDFLLDQAKNIVGTRNRIIHSYDNISDEVLWTIVVRDLPKLEVQVEQLLSE
jgi:uncharacterized protein with HEPN domain